jgi:beta-aspartyl-peptidase (threonine type)
MMKLVLAKWATDRVNNEATPEAVAKEAISYLHRRLQGHGGIILIDRRGRIGVAHNTPRMAWAVQREGGVNAGIEAPL